MAMGKRKTQDQQALFIPTTKLPQSVAHPFYAKLNEVLAGWKFDAFVEEVCAKFYDEKIGRPGLAPGKYFRLLLIGYFEGIGSERGIPWRLADSLALRRFVGIGLDEYTPDHSTIPYTAADRSGHPSGVFSWVLGVLADRGLVQGQRIAIDATNWLSAASARAREHPEAAVDSCGRGQQSVSSWASA